MDATNISQEPVDEKLSFRDVLDHFDRIQPSARREIPRKAPNRCRTRRERTETTTEPSSNRKYISVFVFDYLVLQTFYVPLTSNKE